MASSQSGGLEASRGIVARIQQKLPKTMNRDPQLARHAVLLPPSLAPVAADTATRRAPRVVGETWQARQRRFRQVVLGVGGAMVLLLVVALSAKRAPHTSTAQPVSVTTANSISTQVEPSRATVARAAARPHVGSRLVVDAPVAAATVSARLASQKIAVSETRSKPADLGVSKPQSRPASTSAFDAPFVPPMN